MLGKATLCIDTLRICVPSVLVASVQRTASFPEINLADALLFRAGIVCVSTQCYHALVGEGAFH